MKSLRKLQFSGDLFFSIIIAGLSGAGTALLAQQLRRGLTDNKQGMIGANSVHCRVNNLCCRIIDLGGERVLERKDLEQNASLADGLIFVVDGATPRAYSEAHKYILQIIAEIRPETPILVMWNKRNHPQSNAFSNAINKIPSFSKTIGLFPNIRIWEGSILQNQGYAIALDWLADIAEYHLLALPTRFQALRVYFKIPEFVLMEKDHIHVFDTIFELIQQTLLPPACSSRFIPLYGGNYVIWNSSDLCHCLAIFSEETIPELAQITVDTTLARIEKKLLSFR
ncbi:MAG: ADP-ribosylation factor-like protein [Candidatus Thorarchaeota archaeon]